MPNPISSTSPSTCDPSLASCADAPPPAESPPAGPRAVDIPPVVITGDAGAQALLRRYDASQACVAQNNNAIVAGIAVLGAGFDHGIGSTFAASVNYGKELSTLSECRANALALQSSAQQVIDDCHERGGNVSVGASQNEIICEVTP